MKLRPLHSFVIALAAMSMLANDVTAQSGPITQTVAEARAALAQQQPQQAYNLLMAIEQQAAGDAGFDYWLGVASVRAGDQEQAITALERVIMVQPGHAGARLELAGVFILQRRFLEAEDQLRQVEQMNPPPAAQQAIDRYRQVIANAGESAQANQFSMLGVDVGHDSNYLNYPDSFDLFANTPLQGLALLSEAGTAFSQLRGMHYREFGAPAAFDRSEWLTVVQSRQNVDDEAAVLDSTNVQSSLTFASELSQTAEISVSASASQLWLDGNSYRQMYSSHVGLQFSPNDRTRLMLRLRVRDNNFSDARNDTVGYSSEALFSRQFGDRHQLRLQATTERENTSSDVTRQGGDSQRNVVDVQWRVGSNSDTHRFNTGISYQQLNYKTPGFAVFNLGEHALRDDNSTTVHAEWTWQLSQRWQLLSRLQHRSQSSSIAFFDMDQTVAQVSVNFLF